MEIEFDPAKSERNVAERGLAFTLVEQFEFETALVREDLRHPYGESRFIAIGRIGPLVYVVVYTLRGARVRVISFRRANDREVATYERA